MFAWARQPVVAEWYTRFDYFLWNERYQGHELLDEHGTLYTLGSSRRFGANRFCGELFTGTMNYAGADQAGNPLNSITTYLGVRGEYEGVWDLNLHGWPPVTVFAGIGTRFWIRDLKDSVIPATGQYASGYQEYWWTLYPYVGLEKRWPCNFGEELYARGRVGCTAFTHQFVNLDTGTTLYPQADVIGQIEVGFRHDQLFIAAYFEAMTWNVSPIVRGDLQPLSQNVYHGAEAGTKLLRSRGDCYR